MFIARWQIDARFGQKRPRSSCCASGSGRSARRSGLPEMEFGLLSGSIGACEATLEADHKVESLAQLEQFFEKLGKLEAHGAWGKVLEPHVVSGTSHWQIFRVL